jgi:phage repressor protein C with HTH and peptisase S24 domain
MDGALILTPDPVDYVSRNERMVAVKNPFAFVCVGSSMSPAIEHGDTVVVNPALKPKIGDDCVFVQDQADGTFLALVKRVYRLPTAEHWHVRQFEPREDLKLARKTWAKVFVVDEIRRGH